MKKKIDSKKLSLLIVLAALMIGMTLLSDRFLTTNNILNILTQISINGVLAAGMTFVIITSGIDLSVGSILAVSGIMLAKTSHLGFFPSVMITLLIGAVIGVLNGLLISKFKIQPFIVTLSSMTILRGIAYIITEGSPISGLSDSIQFIGTGVIAGFLPVPVLILILVYILAYFILQKTKLGRYTYAIGDNEEATLNTGIKVDKYKIAIYAISGLLAALSAIILTARLNSAQANAGISYELDAVAAVAIGGTSLTGGTGGVGGTFIGVLILGIISNGLNLLNVSTFYQQVVKGLIILGAVLLDQKKKDK